MRIFQDLSIRYKLQGIVIVACSVALVVASAAFTLYDRTTFLQMKSFDLTATATMLGSNCTAALTFNDPNSAKEILGALRARPHVIRAYIYDSTGKVFAAYHRDPSRESAPPPLEQENGSRVAGGMMIISQSVQLNGEPMGTIYLEANLTDLRDRTTRFVFIDMGVLLSSLFVALLLSLRLNHIISDPIRELAETAAMVTAQGTYSIRAKKSGQDEIGTLFDQFNGMLERIQQRDAAIQKAHDELEHRVEERTAYLNALIETSPLAILVLDSEQRVQLCNPAFESLFQYTRKEIAGKSLNGLIAEGELMEEIRSILHEATEHPVHRVTRRMRKDRTLVDVEVNTVNLVIGGQLMGSLSIYQDISVRRRAEQAMQEAKEAAEASSHAKSEFLANMSHEIRTPMNGILGMTELVLDTELDTDQRENLKMAKSSADALLSLINDILDFSKIEAGKLEIDAIGFQLGDVIGDTLKALSIRASQKGLELAYDIQHDSPHSLVGDPGRLRQILVNLVGNAIKFTERGEVILHVAVKEATAQEVQLHFTISDTGIGIPIEKQATIFEAFAQADGSMTRTYGGTGLGLTISTKLVELMHGRIWVESEPGKGSQFQFTAHFEIQQGAQRTTMPRDSGVLRNMRVLIVDDNATNRKILSKMLAAWGMQPTVAEGGKRAIEILEEFQGQESNFPLILLDAQMPMMDGFTLAEAIKGNAEWKAATIMMLSSAGQRGDAKRCREIGVAAYLTKPVGQDELMQAILNALPGRPRPEIPAAVVTRHSLREKSHQLRILLAEDNAVNQKLAVRLLEKRGHTVAVAGNGKEAVAALQAETFDLVLMDVQMPEMDGFQATAAIRELEKASGNHLPVIAMTAHAMVGDRERCLAAGMDDYLTKPIRLEELNNLLARYSAKNTAEHVL